MCGGTFERVDHDEQFHDRAVDGKAERLDDEHIAPTHIIIDFHEDIFVTELKNICISEGDMQMLTNGCR
jgi:hypothetical protein